MFLGFILRLGSDEGGVVALDEVNTQDGDNIPSVSEIKSKYLNQSFLTGGALTLNSICKQNNQRFAMFLISFPILKRLLAISA